MIFEYTLQPQRRGRHAGLPLRLQGADTQVCPYDSRADTQVCPYVRLRGRIYFSKTFRQIPATGLYRVLSSLKAELHAPFLRNAAMNTRKMKANFISYLFLLGMCVGVIIGALVLTS